MGEGRPSVLRLVVLVAAFAACRGNPSAGLAVPADSDTLRAALDTESRALEISRPPSIRPWDTSATALAKAIAESRGDASIAFKEIGSPRSLQTGVRAAVSRRTIDAGLTLLRARGVTIVNVYRSMGSVHVKIDGETAAGLFGHPMIDFIEPAQRRTPIGGGVRERTWPFAFTGAHLEAHGISAR